MIFTSTSWLSSAHQSWETWAGRAQLCPAAAAPLPWTFCPQFSCPLLFLRRPHWRNPCPSRIRPRALQCGRWLLGRLGTLRSPRSLSLTNYSRSSFQSLSWIWASGGNMERLEGRNDVDTVLMYGILKNRNTHLRKMSLLGVDPLNSRVIGLFL